MTGYTIDLSEPGHPRERTTCFNREMPVASSVLWSALGYNRRSSGFGIRSSGPGDVTLDPLNPRV
jgi:hypothetical protein